MNTIKKNFLLCLSLSFMLFTCEEFLEKEPQDSLTTAGYFRTSEDAIAAVNAAYDGFQHMDYYGLNYPMILNMSGADAVKGGNSPGDRAEYLEFGFYTVNANNIRMVEFYRMAWGAINRANFVLDNVSQMEVNLDLTEGLKTRVLAEATFLRGLHYYNLVLGFGGLPLYESVPEINSDPLSRASLEDTWAFIIRDFENAADGLPVEYDAANVGRATKGAAHAMLARISALRGEWDNVLTYVDLVKNSDANYNLADTYEENFDQRGNNNQESIFEIQYSLSNTSLNVWSSSGDWNSNWFSKYSAPKVGDAGWAFMSPTEDLVNDYEAGDLRLGATVYQDGDPYGDNVFDPTLNNHLPNAGPYGLKKYTVVDLDNSAGNGTDINYKIVRFGEILLLEAEAQNEINGVANAALEPLNRIRTRAGLLPISAGGLTQDELRDIILHERRVELAYEGVRFYDLIYRDRAAEFLGARGYVPGDELFPIPAGEIELTGWEQN